jgi:hypothetical protein
MNKKKERFNILMHKAKVLIEKVAKGSVNGLDATSELKVIIDEHSTINEKEYFEETNDLPVENSVYKYKEMAQLYDIILDLFANELTDQSVKIKKIKNIID